MARDACRENAARRGTHGGGVRPSGARRVGAGRAAAGERVQGPAGAEHDRADLDRPDGGLVSLAQGVVGAPLDRVDGPLKVTGAARYAYEHQVDGVTYASLVQSSIARGRIVSVEVSAALTLDGVVGVLWHENALRLQTENGELQVLQSDAVAFRGQIVAIVVAATPEAARHAARVVEVRYETEDHDVELSSGRDDLVPPPGDDADAEQG